MRLRLVLPFAALLVVGACDNRPASKTEIAARTPVPAATTAACPPQPVAPACPPAARKAPAKASGVAARSARAGRKVPSRNAAAGRTHRYGHRAEDELADRPPIHPYYGSSEVYSSRDARRGEAGPGRDSHRRYSQPEDRYSRGDRYGGYGYRRPPPAPDRYGPERYDDRRYDEGRYDEGRYQDERYGGDRRYSGHDDRYDRGERRVYRGRGQGYAESHESYSESESSSYREERVGDGGCCDRSDGDAAGFDDFGYLTWPGKVR